VAIEKHRVPDVTELCEQILQCRASGIVERVDVAGITTTTTTDKSSIDLNAP